MWIMIAGPYGSGLASSGRAADVERAQRLQALNQVALEVFRRGHIPIVGVNLALPMIALAGPESYADLMMPLSLALAERCDAVLRLEGPSAGADREVARIVARGGRLFRSPEEIPQEFP